MRRALPSLLVVMDIPTSRELELETLLRQRDAQVAELTVRIGNSHRRLAPLILERVLG